MTNKIDRLQLITTFLTVAEHGNLSAAARVLGTTQPTVSRRLRDLEALLGTRLAARTTHRFHLTSEGTELQRKSMAWADVWSEWEQDLKATNTLPKGRLSLVGPHGYGSGFLMEAIARFRRVHPQVDISLQLTDRPVDLISLGADCWIYAAGTRDETLHVRRLGLMHRILIAAKDYPACGIRRPEDLARYPLVGLTPSVQERLALQSVRTGQRREVHMHAPVVTDGLLASYSAIRAGLGIGSAALWLCGDDIAAGRMQHVLPTWELQPVPVEAASVAGRFRPARIDAFIDILAGVLQGMPGFEPHPVAGRDATTTRVVRP